MSIRYRLVPSWTAFSSAAWKRRWNNARLGRPAFC
jgi:hypothetical protein